MSTFRHYRLLYWHLSSSLVDVVEGRMNKITVNNTNKNVRIYVHMTPGYFQFLSHARAGKFHWFLSKMKEITCIF